MLSPLPYPLANLLVWTIAGIVAAPYQTVRLAGDGVRAEQESRVAV